MNIKSLKALYRLCPDELINRIQEDIEYSERLFRESLHLLPDCMLLSIYEAEDINQAIEHYKDSMMLLDDVKAELCNLINALQNLDHKQTYINFDFEKRLQKAMYDVCFLSAQDRRIYQNITSRENDDNLIHYLKDHVTKHFYMLQAAINTVIAAFDLVENGGQNA